MGAAIAAHLANAGVKVTLLDIVPTDAPPGDRAARNRIVNEGLERARKSRPASFHSSDQYILVTTGNLDDDFEEVSEADWIIEAIIENLQIKQDLMLRIDAVRKPAGIVSSNTSGIPLKDIAAGRSQGFREHFLGTHFFNPPRYLKLLEVIPTVDTLPEVLGAIRHFGEYRLGKGIVVCKDTPNFIANRLAFGTGAFGMNYVLENGYTVEEVDAITGPLIGRPKTATFRLIDLVGLDIWDHVGRNLAPLIPHDSLAQQYLAAERPALLMQAMVERGWLGNKTRVGFYREVNSNGSKEFWPLDLQSLEHMPPSKPRFESLRAARDVQNLGERLQLLLMADDKAAALVRALTYQAFQYASSLIPEVADSPKPLDDAMRWGFNHEAGYFEMWDMLGVRDTATAMRAAGFPPAPWLDQMLGAGIDSFYEYSGATAVGVYDIARRQIVPLSAPQGVLILREQNVIAENAGATLRDISDGIACLEFHTKMNALDDDIFGMAHQALDRTEAEFDALVIGNEADNFSAGANLFFMVVAAQQGMWDSLEAAARKFQDLNMRMRYFPKPVVVAPAGLALGGGAELTMHAPRVVAAAELYIGLVELGVGIIPAGGGTKEIMRRLLNPPMRTDNAEVFPFLQRAFIQIGQAKVATSAEEARQMGMLNLCDRVVMNRSHLLAEAKKEARHLASTGYRPPASEKIYAPGRDMLGAMRVGAFMLKAGSYISEYDQHIAGKLAYVLSGGDLSRPGWVGEQYILDLEREAFLSLCGEEKTQARMWHMLRNGKPLRN
jgi:3-hydroxyacyl-CoA dehydrogenase